MPRYPGLCLPSQGLDTPKLDASDLLTLAKLLPVAQLRTPQAQVQMTSLLLLLGWLFTHDQAIHTDDSSPGCAMTGSSAARARCSTACARRSPLGRACLC